MRHIWLFLVVSLAMSTAAFAEFEATYKSAFADFENRGAGIEVVRGCISKAQTAISEATTDLQKFNAYVLQSRCAYFEGMLVKDDDAKAVVHDRAMEYAKLAISLQKDRAEGYYFYGINLGRWGLAKGVINSVTRRHELMRSMETAMRKTAIDDEGRTVPGREYDGFGPLRTLGWMYFKLPGIFDGDNVKAEKYLREANEKMPKDRPNSLNVYYLAYILDAVDKDGTKRAESKRMLDEFLKFEGREAEYNPKRVPETKDDIIQAKELRKGQG